MALVTLKRRSEFLRVRGGSRWSGPAFVVEAKARDASSGDIADAPRFGFTVTKKLGSAVVRNRIRRRLREQLRQHADRLARPQFDYVVVARAAALDRRAESLVRDFETAFRRLHQPPEADAAATDGRGRGSPRAETRSQTSPARPSGATVKH